MLHVLSTFRDFKSWEITTWDDETDEIKTRTVWCKDES